MSTRTRQRLWRGTPRDLIEAATVGARIATRVRRARGQDDAVIRCEVIAMFKQRIEPDNEFEFETLMAAVQRGIEAVLTEFT